MGIARATAHEDVNSGSPRPTAALTRSNPNLLPILIDMPVVLLFMLDVENIVLRYLLVADLSHSTNLSSLLNYFPLLVRDDRSILTNILFKYTAWTHVFIPVYQLGEALFNQL
jgi:hypothetical protein